MSAKSITPEFICKTCGKTFRLHASRVRDRGTVLHCSWECRYGRNRFSDVLNDEDFLVANSKKTKSGCILWQGDLSPVGYGLIKGKKTHRISFGLFVGPITEGLHVLHKCDVRNCINPVHLFLGTHQENLADMVAKGRNIKGSRSNFAKLNEGQVIELRRLASQGVGKDQLAIEFGIKPETVHDIVRRKRWKTL